MPFSIKVKRGRAHPSSNRSSDEILAGITEGRLKPGDRLPPERELASTLGVARGTVTRAYAELARRGLIELVRGRGSIVSSRKEGPSSGRKEKAQGLISSSHRPAGGHAFRLRRDPDHGRPRPHRAGGAPFQPCHCGGGLQSRNPGHVRAPDRLPFPGGRQEVLLDELARDSDPARRLGDFDMVLVTSTHYADLCAMAPSITPRVHPVAVSPSQETVMRLAVVKPGQDIGLLCESTKFFAIVASRLKEMRSADSWTCCTPRDRRARWPPSCGRRGSSCFRPGGSAVPTREETHVLHEFTNRGGLTVVFDYLIEKGSLVYVEQRIGALLSAKGTTGRRPDERMHHRARGHRRRLPLRGKQDPRRRSSRKRDSTW